MSDFTPDDIAKWISNDTDKRTIAETYHGLRVNPGNSLIDMLINAIEVNWLDFDPADQRFVKVAQNLFQTNNTPYPRNPDQWISLINRSSQSSQLKELLTSEITGKVKETPEIVGNGNGSGGFRVTFKDGTYRDYSDVVDSGRDYIYAGVGPPSKHERWRRGGYNKKPKQWMLGKVPGNNRKYYLKYNVVTLKKDNIKSIAKLRN